MSEQNRTEILLRLKHTSSLSNVRNMIKERYLKNENNNKYRKSLASWNYQLWLRQVLIHSYPHAKACTCLNELVVSGTLSSKHRCIQSLQPDKTPNGPGHAKTCRMPYATNKGTGQPAHPRSLISTFVVRCLDSMICILAISKVSGF